jgi:prepilin-type N-terminal cleavage/methylation domain-containing protein
MRSSERHPRAAESRGRAGFTLLELIVVMAVLTVAVTMFTSMVVHTTRQRGINRENAIAANAARTIVELMRNEKLSDVFALYNGDASDDPDGPGTGPGSTFAVPGLTPLDGDADGLAGEVHLPVIGAEEEKPPATWGTTTLDILTLGLLGTLFTGGGGGGKKGKLAGGGGGSPALHYTLREDFQDARMGLPRDLNGDSLIDDCDHSLDYLILPVHVEIVWRGRFGPRRYDLYTQLAVLAKEGG